MVDAHKQIRATRIALTGPMGAGKSTIGRLLAQYLDGTFTDLDELVEQRTGKSVPLLFAKSEAAFRNAEADAAREWLGRPPNRDAPAVVGLGGGTLQSDALADAFVETSTIIHLNASAETLVTRLEGAGIESRPLLAQSTDPVARLNQLIHARADGYARASMSISTEEGSPSEIAVTALRALYDPDFGPWSGEPRHLAAEINGAEPVSIGRGASPLPPVRRAVLVWDTNLPSCHWGPVRGRLETLAEEGIVVVERAGGEGAKTAESLLDGWRTFLDSGVDRDTPVWVVGGGTISDLGGMWASTFKRGLPLYVLPTTLLGQLDAAIGGKNGINLGGAKNVVGTIRRATGVHLDPLFLLTLKDADLRGGFAEGAKSGLIGDPELVEFLELNADGLRERSLPALEETAARAAAVKLRVVARDLHEAGERRLLNLGHTLGHALESATRGDDAPLSHGDAVSIGMVFAAELARREGVLEDRRLPDRLRALLDALGLPIAPPALSPSARCVLETALGQDKKRQGGQNVWVLPVRPGVCVCMPVDATTVRETLQDMSWL